MDDLERALPERSKAKALRGLKDPPSASSFRLHRLRAVELLAAEQRGKFAETETREGSENRCDAEGQAGEESILFS